MGNKPVGPQVSGHTSRRGVVRFGDEVTIGGRRSVDPYAKSSKPKRVSTTNNRYESVLDAGRMGTEEFDDLPPPPPPMFAPKRMSVASVSSKIVDEFRPMKKDRTKDRVRKSVRPEDLDGIMSMGSTSNIIGYKSNQVMDTEVGSRLGVVTRTPMPATSTSTSQQIPKKSTSVHTKKPKPQVKAGGDKGPDVNFVDFTVVPILLRAGVKYREAEEFGETLKVVHSEKSVKGIMSSPFALFAALDEEGIEVSDKTKRRIVDDDYWEASAKPGGKKRTSFVYYRASESQASSTPPQQQKTTQRKEGERPRFASVRSEFMQEAMFDSDEEDDVSDEATMQSIRQSINLLKMLAAGNQT